MQDLATPEMAITADTGIFNDNSGYIGKTGDARSKGNIMTYPGGKNASGIAQRIINNMPPHEIYIEPFLGSGAVLRMKKPATVNIGMDMSQAAISLCKNMIDIQLMKLSQFRFIHGDALRWLPQVSTSNKTTLIYADPPYMLETRTSGKIYDFELSDAGHRALLYFFNSSDAMIMLSGYRSALYDQQLAHWNRIDYMAQTHAGLRPESLWLNFPVPDRLHDYRFLGENFRERERIKRKINRFRKKLERLPTIERRAIMAAISEYYE